MKPMPSSLVKARNLIKLVEELEIRTYMTIDEIGEFLEISVSGARKYGRLLIDEEVAFATTKTLSKNTVQYFRLTPDESKVSQYVKTLKKFISGHTVPDSVPKPRPERPLGPIKPKSNPDPVPSWRDDPLTAALIGPNGPSEPYIDCDSE